VPIALLVLAGSVAVGLMATLPAGSHGARLRTAPRALPARFSQGGLLRLPAAARGPVSAALGAGASAYRVTAAATTGTFTARNADQGLSARFDSAGVSVAAGATHLAISLRAVGYAGVMRVLPAVAPQATQNRVLFTRDGIQEWYVNGPLGLEQSFTVEESPASVPAHRSEPLTLAIAFSGNARPSLNRGLEGITLQRTGAPTLGYSGLAATDARGRPLHSWLELRGKQLLLRVNSAGARYPLHIDPFIHQGEKLTVSGLTGPYGYVGMSVALSADGDTALIGAPADNEYVGSAWVFTRSGSTWTQQAKLTGADTVGEAWFGESVALSADGNTAIVGGPSDNGQAGAAWVFTRSGSSWTQQGEPLSGGGEVGGAFFGHNVALSADGNTALVGGYNDNEHRGAAWVFTRSGTTWTQQGTKLTGSGELGFFGWGVALSAEGNTALIGEWGVGGGIGAAWVFTRSGSSWSRQGEALTARGEGGYPWFGYSLALSGDGNTAVIGAPHADGYAGAAWVYTRAGSDWSQQGAPLTGGEEVGEGELGYSTALSASGDTALLGGRVDEGFHGGAWAFQRSGSVWAQYGGKLTGSGEGANREEFGWSVALSADAETALVGSPCDKACIGSASVFVNPPAAPEFGKCQKVAQGAGVYGSSACTSTGGKRDYEWTPGVSSGFTTRLASGSLTLETVGAAKITCSGESGTGRYAGTKRLDDVLLTLTGCEHSGEHCTSAGAPTGEIVSSALEGVLGIEQTGAEAKQDKIALDLAPVEGAGAVFAFSCGTDTVSIRGSVIAPVKSNKVSLSAPLKFSARKGKQKPQSFAGEPNDVLEASFDGGAYEQAGLTLSAMQINEEDVEINSVA